MLYEVNTPSTLVLARTKGVKRGVLCLMETSLIGIFVQSFWVGLGDSIVF